MVNYAKFCDDLDIVFNLPVIPLLFRTERKNPHCVPRTSTTLSPIPRKRRKTSMVWCGVWVK